MQMVPCGLFSGVIVIVGNSVGEGSFRRAKMAAVMGFVYEIVGSALTAFLVRSLLRPLGEAYTNDMDVVPVFMNIMPSVFLVLVLSGANKGLLGSLRALKKQILATITLCVTLYGIALPLSYYLGVKRGYGVKGLWYGLAVSQLLSAAIFAIELMKLNWEARIKELASN